MPGKPCPEVPRLHIFEPPQGWGLYHHPGQPGPVPDCSSSKEIFPNIESKPPLTQLEAITSRPILFSISAGSGEHAGGGETHGLTLSVALGNGGDENRFSLGENSSLDQQPAPTALPARSPAANGSPLPKGGNS